MEKKRILLVSCNHLNLGGVQTVMMNIIRALHQDYIFDVVVFEKNVGLYEDEVKKYGGKIYRIVRKNKSKYMDRVDIYLRGIWLYNRMKKILKSEKYYAIHCNNSIEEGICLKAAKSCKVLKRIAHVHTVLEKKVRFSRKILNIVYLSMIERYSTDKIGCSMSACESFYSNNDYNVISNAYNENKIHYSEYEDNSLSLIQVGAYSVNKNQLFTIDILEKIHVKYPNARLILFGFELDNGILKQIEKHIKEKELQNFVQFVEGCDDLMQCFKKALYLVFPSISEGFGIVPVEAQAAGLRCYVSEAVPSEVDCGGCVFLNLQDGAEYWAKKIIDDYENIGDVHERFDCNKFTNMVISEKYRKLYGG